MMAHVNRLLQKSLDLRLFRRLSNLSVFRKTASGKTTRFCFSLATALLASTDKSVKERLKAPDPSTLTNSHLIRAACGASVDSASTLFHQTVIALIQAEQEYVEAVHRLVNLLDYHLQSLNLGEEHQNNVWDMIIAQKQVVKEKKDDKQELELLYQSVENVLNGLAQAAFLAGADLSGIRIGEQIYAVQSHLKQARESSSEADAKLTEMDVKVIKVTSEHLEQGSDDETSAKQKTISDTHSQVE